MTTLTATTISPHETRDSLPAVVIAGVEWPVYKVQAVVIGVLLAVIVAVATESGELTAWTLALGTATAWWVRRAVHARRARAWTDARR